MYLPISPAANSSSCDTSIHIQPAIVRPACRWYGGKWQLGKWVISHFPKHSQYIEPFSGMWSVGLQKPEVSVEIYNDLHAGAVNFWTQLRDSPQILISQIENLKYDKFCYEWAVQKSADDSSIEQALKFYAECLLSYPGGGLKNRGGTSTARLSKLHNHKHLHAIATRIKNLQIYNLQAIEVIKTFDSPDTLFYCDPCYLKQTRNTHNAYQHEMDSEQHIQLAETLRGVSGQVVVSGYKSELYEELFAGWQREEKDTFSTSNRKRQAIECLWIKPARTKCFIWQVFNNLKSKNMMAPAIYSTETEKLQIQISEFDQQLAILRQQLEALTKVEAIASGILTRVADGLRELQQLAVPGAIARLKAVVVGLFPGDSGSDSDTLPPSGGDGGVPPKPSSCDDNPSCSCTPQPTETAAVVSSVTAGPLQLESLETKVLSQLKAIARGLDAKPEKFGDKRRKTSWIQAIRHAASRADALFKTPNVALMGGKMECQLTIEEAIASKEETHPTLTPTPGEDSWELELPAAPGGQEEQESESTVLLEELEPKSPTAPVQLISNENIIPFCVVDRPMSLHILKGLPLQNYPGVRLGIMANANTSPNFQKALQHYPCDDFNYCHAVGGACQHRDNINRCPVRQYIKEHTVKMCDSGIFTREGATLTYDQLFAAYARMGVDYGIMIDVLQDSQATLESAREALTAYKPYQDKFNLVGVAQGTSVEEYLDCYTQLKQLGFQYVAVGGLLKKTPNTARYVSVRNEEFMFQVLEKLRQNYPHDWLFALGCFSLKRLDKLQSLGISADSKAWLFKYQPIEGGDRAVAQLSRIRQTQAHLCEVLASVVEI